ncbi:sulfurtransferase [Metabacillus arenae]|uniref:Sulfurtransferase n=1 Tax=Metabacillus arenae TaxID=2771434 RepID=A0A926NI69_9BACI|nr:sulfurtransferase [Metabacillus arenae]MBD1381791.1 sulfurtransferase [Metabacillus arenae]
MGQVVSIDWVREQVDKPDVQIIDCRFVLGDLVAGQQAYNESHIPGALYVHLEEDLSGVISEHGGRHPLPDAETFANKIGSLGIDENVTVIAYDDQGGAMASRFWWLMQFLGHPKTVVMDGGFSKWTESGFPVTAEIPAVTACQYLPVIQEEMVKSMAEVKEKMNTSGVMLIDSREPNRYRGIEEPIDFKAGHIPGALNFFWKDSLNETGDWKTVEQQRERFSELEQADEIIVYCGSGVTACPNVLALKEAGFTNVRLYSGSWSDWITYPDNPIATLEG